MKEIIKFLKFITHIHSFKPIVSKYWSFNRRRMIYECKCGCKEIRFVSTPFEVPFPIPTTNFLTNEEFEKILHS